MTGYDQTFSDLIRLLEEEATIYARLCELLDREREALLRMAASDLGEIGSEKRTLGVRLKALDESRKLLSERLGRCFAIDPGELTVGRLCEFAPPHLARQLDHARNELRARAEACKKINDYNARAASRGLDLIKSAMDYMIADADPAGKVYQKKGGYGPARSTSPPAIVSQSV